MRFSCAIISISVILGTFTIAKADGPSSIDFEGLADSTPVTTQFPNVVFSQATAISAAISLNEFEAPPHSGSSVIFDDGGPMSISFTTPVTSFSGYFTYGNKVSLAGFDASNVQVATTTSKFNSNFALSGEAGSIPNEFLSISYSGGIVRVVVTGMSGGSSFALDDATTTAADPIQLMLEESGPAPGQAGALDSVLFLRDPFPVVNAADRVNQGADQNTRVILFATNLQLAQGETVASVVVNLTDSANQTYDLPAEDVQGVPNSTLTQVIFRLPNNLPPGNCKVKIKAHSQVSNFGTMRIKL